MRTSVPIHRLLEIGNHVELWKVGEMRKGARIPLSHANHGSSLRYLPTWRGGV